MSNLFDPGMRRTKSNKSTFFVLFIILVFFIWYSRDTVYSGLSDFYYGSDARREITAFYGEKLSNITISISNIGEESAITYQLVNSGNNIYNITFDVVQEVNCTITFFPQTIKIERNIPQFLDIVLKNSGNKNIGKLVHINIRVLGKW